MQCRYFDRFSRYHNHHLRLQRDVDYKDDMRTAPVLEVGGMGHS